MHGCAMINDKGFWGDVKNNKKEGYGEELYANGDRYIGQFM